MKEQNRLFRKLILILILTFVCAALVTARPDPKSATAGGSDGNLSLSPQPGTVDQITHNKGNIVTTIDNWGYIGGYQYYDLPSGEWPRNSGHDYVGEIKYWMGATLGSDTIVANSYDDFQAVPSMINGSPEYKILLSTDPNRYYSYDQSDTVGIGVGRPAYGWRVYDASLGAWVYNQSYHTLSASFSASGPTSLQESHYVMNDIAGGDPLGLEVTQTIMQWNYCYNEDIMFVALEITNNSSNDYTDFAFGLYIDIDVGGPDGTGENGRLGDLVGFDAVENLAWTYDEDARDPGWGDVETGVMGTKYLETPDDIGMTGFRTGDWAAVTSVEDPGRFAMISANIFDPLLPPTDQYYLQCTSGINLTAGRTVRVVYAIVAGSNESDFRANSDMAQQLYDAYFVGPEPPPTPILSVRAVDRKVYLNWTDTSETGLDPLTLINDFAGYKLYRSDNRGFTWGAALGPHDEISECMGIDYKTKATYTVVSPGDPVPHSYIDSGLTNGVEYWYCLAAFDRGDTTIGVDVLQSGFGTAGEETNVVSAMPRKDPAGYYHASTTVTHIYTGPSEPSIGEVIPTVFDASQVTGTDYKVVFEDREDDTYWHVIDQANGDTLIADQTITGADPDLFPVINGLRVVIDNPEREPVIMAQTGFSGSDTTLGIDYPGWWLGSAAEYFFGDFFSDAPIRASYELRYTATSTVGQAWNDTLGVTYSLPFELWDIRTNRQLALFIYDFGLDGFFDSWDLVMFSDYPYNPAEDMFAAAYPYHLSWFFGFDANYNPQPGDVLTIEGPLLQSPDDVFTFKIDGVDAGAAPQAMKNIKVVPNPYFSMSSGSWETNAGVSRLQFQRIPTTCTIRIYTLAGDLVKTIDHVSTDSGAAEWDLLTEEGRQVASGVYFYHVESDYGTHSGRFAVIK